MQHSSKGIIPASVANKLVVSTVIFNIMSDKNERNIVQLSKYMNKAYELRKMHIEFDPI